jgi:hypothetical protein
MPRLLARLCRLPCGKAMPFRLVFFFEAAPPEAQPPGIFPGCRKGTAFPLSGGMPAFLTLR